MLCTKCHGLTVIERDPAAREWEPATRSFLHDETQERCLNCGLISSRLIERNRRALQVHIEQSSPGASTGYSPVPEYLDVA